jgi:Arylsulfotransferase (ASST)
LPFSRVIQVDPESNEIAWAYQDNPVSNFFTPRMGNAQRLPNGNTLITEASFGRVFEVTTQGETVREYVNPYFGGPPNAHTNAVFRAYRYTPKEIARAGSSG